MLPHRQARDIGVISRAIGRLATDSDRRSPARSQWCVQLAGFPAWGRRRLADAAADSADDARKAERRGSAALPGSTAPCRRSTRDGRLASAAVEDHQPAVSQTQVGIVSNRILSRTSGNRPPDSWPFTTLRHRLRGGGKVRTRPTAFTGATETSVRCSQVIGRCDAGGLCCAYPITLRRTIKHGLRGTSPMCTARLFHHRIRRCPSFVVRVDKASQRAGPRQVDPKVPAPMGPRSGTARRNPSGHPAPGTS